MYVCISVLPPETQSKYLARMSILQDFQAELADSTSTLFQDMQQQFQGMVSGLCATTMQINPSCGVAQELIIYMLMPGGLRDLI